MKKSAVIAGSIVLVAVAYTGAAWYVGMEAEKTIRAAVERANGRIVKTLGPDPGSVGATIAIDDYRRGLFSSDARYTVVLQDGTDRTEFAMQDHMQHGPFPWALVSQGSFTPQLAYSRSQLVDTESVKRWFDAARGAMPLTADTRIGFGGRGVTQWEFAPLEGALEDDRLSFSGGHVQVSLSNDFRDSDAEGEFASLVLGGSADEGAVHMKDIRFDATTRTATDETVRVESRLQAATLSVEGMAEENLTIEQATVSLDSTQSGELLDAALRYDFQRILLGDIDLGSMSLGGKVARLNFEAFSALAAEYDAIEREHGVGPGEDFELTAEDESRLLARVRPMLASNPELAVEPVVWRNEKGETSLALTAALQPLPETEAIDPDYVLDGMVEELRLQVSLSRPMLLQAISRSAGSEDAGGQLEMLAAMMFDAYVDRLEQEGLLRREGDLALADIVYREGQVDVNGRSMSLDEFMDLVGVFLM